MALIALITGFMAAFESTLAMPSGSTVMLADALGFVQHSISAGFALQIGAGMVRRPRWTVHLQGATMMALGGLVVAIAVRRFFIGSVPHPVSIMLVGSIALAASLSCWAIMLRQQKAGLDTVWRIGRADTVGNVAVIATGAAVFVTRSNIPDLVIGAVLAAYYALSGWRIALSGKPDAGRPR